MTGPGIFALFRAGPVGLIYRALFKTLIGPFIYGRGGKYDARRYWTNRFKKYGSNMVGSGFEGLSDRENQEMKSRAASDLLAICAREGVDLRNDAILDIGCGGGFFTQRFRTAGAKAYTGADIVDVLFPDLRRAYPEYRFVKTDIVREPLPGRYRFIFMLDVIQSIVTPERLRYAMANIRDRLEEGGIFVVAPLFASTRSVHFYAHQWSRADVLAHFPGFEVGAPVPFRDLEMYAIRKPRGGA